MPHMDVRIDDNPIVKLLEMMSEKDMTVHQLCCRTGSDYRTIKKYLNLIVYIQNSQRLKMETVGLRVIVRRENGNRTNTADR